MFPFDVESVIEVVGLWFRCQTLLKPEFQVPLTCSVVVVMAGLPRYSWIVVLLPAFVCVLSVGMRTQATIVPVELS